MNYFIIEKHEEYISIRLHLLEFSRVKLETRSSTASPTTLAAVSKYCCCSSDASESTSIKKLKIQNKTIQLRARKSVCNQTLSDTLNSLCKMAFSQLEEISFKMIITLGGGISINCIYYTIFSKVLCLSFCQIPSPYQYSHLQIICGNPV